MRKNAVAGGLDLHRPTVLLVLGAVATGCGRGGQERLTALETQVVSLEARLITLEAAQKRAELLEKNAQPTSPALPASPSPFPIPEPPPSGPTPAPAAEVPAEADADGGLVDEIDEDLADLEGDVDTESERVAALMQAVDQLGDIIDDHAAVIDDLRAQVDQLSQDNQYLRQLAAVVSVQDGNVVISQADLILVQGTRPDGFPDGRGRIYQQVTPTGGP